MKTILFGAVAALALSAPVAAQRLGNTVVAVVDTGRIGRECTACRAAGAQIESQARALQQSQQTLNSQLQPEATAIEAAVKALNGRQPDAALQQRIQAFNTRRQTGLQGLARTEQNIRSTELHVSQQIGARLRPIVEQVMQARGATIVVSRDAVLTMSPTVDLTNEVMTRLNQQVPSVSVTPLPQQPAQQQQRPQGR